MEVPEIKNMCNMLAFDLGWTPVLLIMHKTLLTFFAESNIIPSLTVERVKRGYKPSKYGRCSFFRPCIDMCYILSLSKTFVFLMRVRMEVLVMIS